MNAKNVSFSVSSEPTAGPLRMCAFTWRRTLLHAFQLPAILIGFCFASWPARAPPYLPVSSSSNQSHFHTLCKSCVYQQQEVLHSRAHPNRTRDGRRRRRQFNWLCGSSPWVFRLSDCESISIILHVNTHSLHSASQSLHSFGCHTTAVRVENSSHRIPSLSSLRLRYGYRRRRPTGDCETKWIKKFPRVHQEIQEITRRNLNWKTSECQISSTASNCHGVVMTVAIAWVNRSR